MLEKGAVDPDIEIIDPRVLYPLNFDEISGSVKKTGRLAIIEEGHLTCGAASDISAKAAEELFMYLNGPIVRVATKDLPHPYAPVLEEAMSPTEEVIANAINHLLK